MRLVAFSDLHVGYSVNREALKRLPQSPGDWLIIAGDVGETVKQLEWTLAILKDRFERLIWVPGNHELYCLPGDPEQIRGVARYERLVEVCQQRNVVTPEDPYILWPGDGEPTRIVPLFLGYDYTFAPMGLTPEGARQWAEEEGIFPTDEHVLFCDPHSSMVGWCRDRIRYTLDRLEELPENERRVLINHYPLRYDLIRLFRIPRYSPWCGTKVTEQWHRRYRASVVVSGHLHMRATDFRDGVRFEEVSIGYPQHWDQEKGLSHYLREILPGPTSIPTEDTGPMWHR